MKNCRVLIQENKDKGKEKEKEEDIDEDNTSLITNDLVLNEQNDTINIDDNASNWVIDSGTSIHVHERYFLILYSK